MKNNLKIVVAGALLGLFGAGRSSRAEDAGSAKLGAGQAFESAASESSADVLKDSVASVPSPGSSARPGGGAHRWVVGVQVVVHAGDYRSEKTFEDRLSAAVGAALKDPRIGPADAKLVVLPEYVGTWLMVVGEKEQVYQARDKAGAIGALVKGDLDFARYLATRAFLERQLNPFAADFVFKSLLHYKTRKMWAAYDSACSAVAKKYHATLVAGSIVLPDLDKLGDPLAPLYNTTVIFSPDGGVIQSVRKVYPTQPERDNHTASGSLENIRAVDTPFGRVGAVVCADGWYAEIYRRLKGAEVVALPSFGESSFADYDKPWDGYSGHENPADVDKSDVGAITLRQAWRKYAMAGRLRESGALVGVNPFLAGKIWDMGATGYGIGVDLRLPPGRQVVQEVRTSDEVDTAIVVQLD